MLSTGRGVSFQKIGCLQPKSVVDFIGIFMQRFTWILVIALMASCQGYGEENNQDTHSLPFSAYKSNYILYDVVDTEIKFQLSIKFQFATVAKLSNPQTVIENFYLGYSQKSFWDVGKPSSPFSDHNFNPELFYQAKHKSYFLDSYRIGIWEHESNGQDGEKSRSWDRIYIRPVFRMSDRLTLATKIWFVVNKDENNSDIQDFFGNAKIHCRYLSKDDLKIEISGRKGNNSSKGSLQADISFPWNYFKERVKTYFPIVPFTSPLRLNPHWIIQGWYGYGENLLHYDKKETVIRFGILFTI